MEFNNIRNRKIKRLRKKIKMTKMNKIIQQIKGLLVKSSGV